MNYNDQILENKTFNFFKQLMYNLALAICILLVGVLIMVWGFKFRLYEVLSDSQAPYFVRGDMVVIKSQKEYKVGDIIKFRQGNKNVTHRLVGILSENGKTYFICHGDNVSNVDGTTNTKSDWEDDATFVGNLINEGKKLNEIKETAKNIQTPTENEVDGKVVATFKNYGNYFNFIKSHSSLFIVIVVGIWCVCNVIQNELESNKIRRFI